jgi:hypothetical protein
MIFIIDILKPKQKALDILVITQISEANVWNLGLGHINKKISKNSINVSNFRFI